MQPQGTERRRAELVQAAGAVAMSRAEYSNAKRWLEEARESFDKLADLRGEADSLRLLGELALAMGDVDVAVSRYRDAYQKYLALGEPALAEECQDKAGIAQTRETPTPATSGEQAFKTNLPLMQLIINSVASRHGATRECDEFASFVFLRMIEDDYRILRRFEGRSSLASYLSSVINRMFLDYRNHLWGKWRPSAEARRLGENAVLLERLIARDGLTVSEATSLLHVNLTSKGTSISKRELSEIAARLPPRHRPQFVSDDVLRSLPVATDAMVPVLERERALRAQEVKTALNAALQKLDADDRLLVQLRFLDNLSLVEIAKSLRMDQKLLYRRLQKLMNRLRSDLEAQGISSDDAADVIENAML